MFFCAELCAAKAAAVEFFFAERTEHGRCAYCNREGICFRSTGRREAEIPSRDIEKLRQAFLLWIDRRLVDRDATNPTSEGRALER
jgi:hypothetical protein